MLRPGNAGSNTAADHITVLDLALAQISDHLRHGQDVLIRCDSAGASYAFLNHIRALREHGVRTFFSVGVAITEPVRAAITACRGVGCGCSLQWVSPELRFTPTAFPATWAVGATGARTSSMDRRFRHLQVLQGLRSPASQRSG